MEAMSFSLDVGMTLSRTRKFAIVAGVAAVVIAGLAVVSQHWPGSDANARRHLLRFLPADATVVVFLDLDEFRTSPFLAKFYSWAPHLAEDSEYAQFVRDTGFSYERDLKRAMLAVSNRGSMTSLLAVADGNFDRKKVEAFLNRNGKSIRQGKWDVFLLNASANDKPLSLAFLSDTRIAITDSGNLSAVLSSAAGDAGHVEWNERFERLAGTPLFAVIRQDPALQDALNAAAPGGFRSPALSAMLDRLKWISIAGKPEGDVLRVVTEGECLSDPTASQLRDFLQGVLLLAQNGLNDAKLRQQLNPEERQAYLEILKSADIQKIDRGEWKSVRVVLSVTPSFLEVARATSLGATANKAQTPQEVLKKKSVSGTSKTPRKN